MVCASCLYVCLAAVILMTVLAQIGEDSVGSCAADDVECNEKTSRVMHEGASAKQKEHWRQWYWSLDTNHDGALSGKDRDIVIKRHIEAYDLDESSVAAKGLTKWWNECALFGREDPLSPEDFVEIQNEQYMRLGADAYRRKITQEMLDVFPVVDADGDGFYSQKEYTQIFKDYGHNEIANDMNGFNAHNPVDGKIPVVKLARTWVDFVLGDDTDHVFEDIITKDGMN